MLGSAVLPSWNLLLVLVGVLVVITLLLRRSFIKLHSKAQIALHETLEAKPASQATEESKPGQSTIPSLLHRAKLMSVTVGAQSLAVGRMIAELKLRTVTGASIVGIERIDREIVNPPVDEELQSGDRVLLIGTEEQVSKAREMLA